MYVCEATRPHATPPATKGTRTMNTNNEAMMNLAADQIISGTPFGLRLRDAIAASDDARIRDLLLELNDARHEMACAMLADRDTDSVAARVWAEARS